MMSQAANNSMALNGNKFELMRFINKEIKTAVNYSFSNQVMPERGHTKDPATYMSKAARISHHHHKVTNSNEDV